MLESGDVSLQLLVTDFCLIEFSSFAVEQVLEDVDTPFALDRRRFREMQGEALIQVRWQFPEIQQLLSQGGQGSYMPGPPPARLHYCQADPLEGLQQQFRTRPLGLPAG